MKRSIVAIVPWVALVAAWVALWGEVTLASVLGGVVVAVIAVVVSGGPRPGPSHLRPVAALRFLVVVAWSLVKATSLVAWEVITPRNRIVEGIIAVPLPGASPMVQLLVTNAIGLTPGTIVVEVDEDPCVLFVHVLHLHDVERVRAELVELGALAMSAFGAPTDPAVDHDGDPDAEVRA